MEQTYDAIVLGTGLKEGIISALLSVHGKKVLHMDRNDYYGGECASMKLTDLYKYFGEDPATIPANFGKDSDWNIDMIPKFILSAGDLFRMLKHADCLNYLEFGRVAGSFLVKKGDIHRVPTTQSEALACKAMGLFEKKRMAGFLQDIDKYFDEGKPMPLDIKKVTTKQIMDHYKLDDFTINFIIHAMALQFNDECLGQVAFETMQRISLYINSVARFGASSYIYPIYGLGDLPQAFARLAAVWGGTYMLNRPIDEILFDDAGKVKGIKSNGESAFAPLVIGDPSYFPEYVKKAGKVGRGISILKGPVMACADACEKEKDRNGNVVIQTSAQIILTGVETGRKDDIYVTTQGYNHRTTPKGLCLGFISSLVESDSKDELKAGWKILESAGILKTFYKTYDVMEPKDKAHEAKGIFVSKSYDATSHFETTAQDSIEMYERITGEKLDLDSKIVRPPIPGMEDQAE